MSRWQQGSFSDPPAGAGPELVCPRVGHTSAPPSRTNRTACRPRHHASVPDQEQLDSESRRGGTT